MNMKKILAPLDAAGIVGSSYDAIRSTEWRWLEVLGIKRVV